MSKIILKVENLTKKFKNRIAVDNVSFEICEGEIFGLIGPNGAGKSTIIRMITGLSTPSNGKINICGFDLSKNFENAIKNVGGIIENPEFYNYMTGLENLKFYASLYGKIDLDKIDKIIKVVKMENRVRDRVSTYSLGMKQRLGIAQSLLHSPKLLILDEPTNGLDPDGIKEIRNFLIKYAKKEKIAILISSHILSEMEHMCDNIMIINNGKVVENRSLEQIKESLLEQQKLCLTVDYPNFAGKLIMEEFKVEVHIAGSNVIMNYKDAKVDLITSFIISKGLSIFGINTVQKSLEEIYMDAVASTGTSIK